MTAYRDTHAHVSSSISTVICGQLCFCEAHSPSNDSSPVRDCSTTVFAYLKPPSQPCRRSRLALMHPNLTLATRVNCISTSWQLRRACDHTRIPICRVRAASRRHCRPMSDAGTVPAAEPSGSAQGTHHLNAETPVAEDLVQYLVLRKDLWSSLKWPLGSIIAQACHASTAAL